MLHKARIAALRLQRLKKKRLWKGYFPDPAISTAGEACMYACTVVTSNQGILIQQADRKVLP